MNNQRPPMPPVEDTEMFKTGRVCAVIALVFFLWALAFCQWFSHNIWDQFLAFIPCLFATGGALYKMMECQAYEEKRKRWERGF